MNLLKRTTLKNGSKLSACLLFAFSASSIALDIPQGEKVHQVSTKSASLEGYAVASQWNSTNKTYLPINVISHVSYVMEGLTPL